MTIKRRLALALTIVMVASFAASAHAKAPYLRSSSRRAAKYNWHANYSHSAYGQPVALVVPPTAQLQTSWNWGAPSSHVRRIDHQFGRDHRHQGSFVSRFRSTPPQPNSTDQFGVYYVRGPWYPTQR